MDWQSLKLFYVDDTELVIVEDNEFYGIVIPHGEINYPIMCKPTHPGVYVSLISQQQYTAKVQNWLEPKVRQFFIFSANNDNQLIMGFNWFRWVSIRAICSQIQIQIGLSKKEMD